VNWSPEQHGVAWQARCLPLAGERPESMEEWGKKSIAV